MAVLRECDYLYYESCFTGPSCMTSEQARANQESTLTKAHYQDNTLILTTRRMAHRITTPSLFPHRKFKGGDTSMSSSADASRIYLNGHDYIIARTKTKISTTWTTTREVKTERNKARTMEILMDQQTDPIVQRLVM